MSLFFVIVRISGFVLFFVALLCVKKTRVRHLPSRRTRVSRHHGETCVWLERLTNAVLYMFYTALQEEEEEGKRSNDEKDHQRVQQSHMFDAIDHRLHNNKNKNNSNNNNSCGRNRMDVKDASLRILEALEERVEGFLEDRGIAANASFKAISIGHKPPTIRAIRVTNLTDTESASSVSVSSLMGTTGVTMGTTGPSVAAVSCSTSVNGGVTGTGGTMSMGGKNITSQKAKGRVAQSGMHVFEDMADLRRGDPLHEETYSLANALLPDSAIELEAEVEYAGGLDVSLQADLCLPRGRLLPMSIRVNDIRYIKAHVRVRATMQHERATMDSRRRPYLQCTLWLESEPAFSFNMTTLFSRYRVYNFFAVPVVVKFLLLRFVRQRMMCPNTSGVTMKIPLPENIVDGGIQQWCTSANEGATTASSVICFGFPRGVV